MTENRPVGVWGREGAETQEDTRALLSEHRVRSVSWGLRRHTVLQRTHFKHLEFTAFLHPPIKLLESMAERKKEFTADKAIN